MKNFLMLMVIAVLSLSFLGSKATADDASAAQKAAPAQKAVQKSAKSPAQAKPAQKATQKSGKAGRVRPVRAAKRVAAGIWRPAKCGSGRRGRAGCR